MIPRSPFSRGYRALVWLTGLSLLTAGVPQAAASGTEGSRRRPGNWPAPIDGSAGDILGEYQTTQDTTPAQPPSPVGPTSILGRRTVPKVTPPPTVPRFSEVPTTEEIFRARVFEEPLAPTAEPSPADNKDITAAIEAYLAASEREDTSALDAYLAARTSSPWRLALLTNLAILARQTGYFSRSIDLARSAWELGRGEEERNPRALANRAFVELVELYARVGEMDKLSALFDETRDRSFGGSMGARIEVAKEGLAIMKTTPELAFRCGPLAVESVLTTVRPGSALDETLPDAISTIRGTSLSQVSRLAGSLGLGMRMAYWPKQGETDAMGESTFPVPSVVHWRAGHFAALIERSGRRYLVKDPTFGNEVWVSERAIETETTGYFLVRSLPKTWREVGEAEGSTVFGKGAPSGKDPNANAPEDKKNCEPCQGMAAYQFFELHAALALSDIPVGYRPPLGPSVQFKLSYGQTEISQPTTFSYSNVGPMWTHDWVSYVSDDPAAMDAQSVLVYRRGGGREMHTLSGGSSPGHFRTQAAIVRAPMPSFPVRYERRLPDGSVEVFAQPDGSVASPRKVFMTESIDPQGNKLSFVYDSQLRLAAVVDAIGQVTTLSYESADPLKITRVTDPFGRSAALQYDTSGRLERITDVIGLASSFTYGAGDFITSLTTPYGTTRFEWAALGASRWVQASDPMGGVERYHYQNEHSTLIPDSDPAGTQPPGWTVVPLAKALTFHWPRRLMALAPLDYSKAEQIHWTYINHVVAGVPRMRRMPLENRIWYKYPGQPYDWHIGSVSQPSVVTRRIVPASDPGGSVDQTSTYEYNTKGMVTRSIDPLGREMVYEYAANGIDRLVTKRKKAGGLFDTLETRTYNSQHQPLTVTDASGDVTTFTYKPNGQIESVRTPPPDGFGTGPLTTYNYDTNGYLTSIVGPVSGATTSFTYDSLGRTRTTTDSTGYTTTMTYDAFDRVVKVTHPDTTFEQMEYEKLDMVGRRDRLGRWTRTVYDPLRRAISVKDPSNGVTSYQWCACGTMDALVDANLNKTAWEYDLQGRVVKETRADGKVTSYSYEPTTSRLITRTDRRGVVTAYDYFLDNQLKSRTYSSLPGTVAATPVVNHTYDVYTGLPSTVANGTDTLTWTYDTEDRMKTEQSSLNGTTVEWDYDPAGNRRLVKLGGTNFNTYTYDVTSRLTQVAHGALNFDLAYDTSSRRTSLTYPNGIVTTYTPYDAESRVTRINAKLGAIDVTDFTYGHNVVGNRTSKGTLEFSENYGYDSLDRLTTADRASGTPRGWVWAYDKVGNRTAQQVDNAPGVVATQASYNNMNQLTATQLGGILGVVGSTNEAATVTVGGQPAATAVDNSFKGAVTPASGTTTFSVVATDGSGNTRTSTFQVTGVSGGAATLTYDENGNLTQKVEGADTWAYIWDAENRLKEVKKNAVTQATFRYDPSDRRVEKVAGGTTFRYVYDNEDWIRRTGGTSMDMVHGPRVDESLAQDVGGTMTYFHADASSSVQKQTSSSGTLTQSIQYDAWGNALAGTPGPYGFTGREPDAETGLQYYRARYYDSKGGMFISEDPVGRPDVARRPDARHIVGEAQPDQHLYRYPFSNPIRWRDPSGLGALSDKAKNFFKKWGTKIEFVDKLACEQTMKECKEEGRVRCCQKFPLDEAPKPYDVQNRTSCIILTDGCCQGNYSTCVFWPVPLWDGPQENCDPDTFRQYRRR